MTHAQGMVRVPQWLQDDFCIILLVSFGVMWDHGPCTVWKHCRLRKLEPPEHWCHVSSLLQGGPFVLPRCLS